MKEEIIAYGHPNITAKHKTTLEITKAEHMERIADCIIAIRANKACKDLNEELKNSLKKGKKVEITIEAEGVEDKIVAYGSSELKLNHLEDIVIRKSGFIDDRTLAINADKVACDLKKELVQKLTNPKTKIKIIIEVNE